MSEKEFKTYIKTMIWFFDFVTWSMAQTLFVMFAPAVCRVAQPLDWIAEMTDYVTFNGIILDLYFNDIGHILLKRIL